MEGELQARTKPAELTTRVKTAAVLIVVTLALLTLSHFFWWGRVLASGVALLVVLVASFEFVSFSSLKREAAGGFAFLSAIFALPPAVIFLTILHYAQSEDMPSLVWCSTAAFLTSTVLLLLCIVVWGRTSLEIAKEEFSTDLPALFHIAGGGACLCALTLHPLYLLWVIVVVAVGDSAAYFGGKAIGGPKLAPAFSPNKTVSGSLTGLVAAVVVGTLLGVLISESWSTAMAASMSALVSITGALGDLLKSYLKRVYAVKDSGTILPGHGGVYDRIDGILAGSFIVLLVLV